MAEEPKGTIVVPAPSNSRRESNSVQLPVVQSETAAIMNAIAVMARDPQVDPDKLIKIFEIRDRELARVAKQEFVDAMARFKANPPKIVKDKHVYFEGRDGKRATDYWHATLANVVGSVIGGLAAVGITHEWKIRHEGNLTFVTCILRHVGGHEERTDFPPVAPDETGNKNKIQAVQSAITYAQRHTLLAAVGLAAGDDDDGKGSGKDYERISESQVADLDALISELGGNKVKLLKYLKLETLADIRAENFEATCRLVRELATKKDAADKPVRGAK